jgi:KUP system potassium uptake protein
MKEMTVPLEMFMGDFAAHEVHRVPGTAVFMSGNPVGTPLALLHNLKHNKVLHEQVVILTVITEELAYLPEAGTRAILKKLQNGFWCARIYYGFMEQPNVPAALAAIDEPGFTFEPMKTTYFIGRETILSTSRAGLCDWRGSVFAWMARNTGDATSYFALPPNSVVELGARLEV